MKTGKTILVAITLVLVVVGGVLAATSFFTDVPRDAAYYPAVKFLYDLGVVKPDANGKFNPDSPATKADVAQMIYPVYNIQPKYAVTMREYGGRFADMYFAAKGGNWALAAYQDHYMRAALKPVRLTKPGSSALIDNFNETYLDPIVKAISQKDFQEFAEKYKDAIDGCNTCHEALGYPFVKVKAPTEPAQKTIDYGLKTEPTEFAEFAPPK